MKSVAEEFNVDWMGDCLQIPGELSRNLIKNYGFDYYYPVVSKSPKIKEIFHLIKKVSKSNSSIFEHSRFKKGNNLKI